MQFWGWSCFPWKGNFKSSLLQMKHQEKRSSSTCEKCLSWTREDVLCQKFTSYFYEDEDVFVWVLCLWRVSFMNLFSEGKHFLCEKYLLWVSFFKMKMFLWEVVSWFTIEIEDVLVKSIFHELLLWKLRSALWDADSSLTMNMLSVKNIFWISYLK